MKPSLRLAHRRAVRACRAPALAPAALLPPAPPGPLALHCSLETRSQAAPQGLCTRPSFCVDCCCRVITPPPLHCVHTAPRGPPPAQAKIAVPCPRRFTFLLPPPTFPLEHLLSSPAWPLLVLRVCRLPRCPALPSGLCLSPVPPATLARVQGSV